MQDELEKIKQMVFNKRPVLKDIIDQYGKLSLFEYVQNNWQFSKDEPDPVFVSIIKNKATALYGVVVATKICEQLQNKPLLSTIDHHGIWGHPFFVNSSLIYSLYFKQSDLAITLATESVSLNNTTSWSGSVLWHDQNMCMQRASFFPDSYKQLPVFSTPPIAQSNIRHFSQVTKGKFEKLLFKLQFDEIIKLKSFSDQSCLLSKNFWHSVFPSAPALIYLPLESLISEYLLEILKNPEHVLSRLILTLEGRNLWQKFFGQEHTFMFWKINNKGRREEVTILPSDTAEIIELIHNKRLYASSPLCFMVLLYAGFACVGGFTQTTWLTNTKSKFVELLKELDQAAWQKIEQIATKNFAESSLAWLKNQTGSFIPTAADLFLTTNDNYSNYQAIAKRLTLEQSLNLAMPNIYKALFASTDRKLNIDSLELQIFNELQLNSYI